ncbi:hypothetical protein WJX73_003605 [Symbiochloris irregularis]|uniref:FAD-binding FR-type domain-containing protein n=1 Tax=Symbiochloris irregularis TaxID=706552 RepID=A0AAW1PYI2_9CHLO
MGVDVKHNTASPFHAGEQEVQRLAGSREVSEKMGRAVHSTVISPTAAAFLKEQCLIYLSTLDEDNNLWASCFYGVPGFLDGDDESRLVIKPIHRLEADPSALQPGSLLGTYVIELSTRKRFRTNGTIRSFDGETLVLDVCIAFPSCPKFIQARKVIVSEQDLEHRISSGAESIHRGGRSLGPEEKALISRSDTCHLASCYEGPETDGGSAGCDISHRGGPPGFVHIEGDDTLYWADFIGNFTFTTLGNIHVDPRAGLLFLDYDTGDTLQLTGTCEIKWEEHALPGAERTLYFKVHEWVRVEGNVPVHVEGGVGMSPYNPAPEDAYHPGIADDRIDQIRDRFGGEPQVPGRMMLRCLSKVKENHDTITYTLERAGTSLGPPPPVLRAGQYATVDLKGAGADGKVLTRTWTISCPPAHTKEHNTISLTIKNIGLASGWLADNMVVGRTFTVRGIEGTFTPQDTLPGGKPPAAGVVLLAGGIGITPLRSMLPEFVESGVPVTLIYSVKTLADAVFLNEFAEASQQAKKLDVHLLITNDQEHQQNNAPEGVHVHTGRVSSEILEQVVPSLQERAAYLCGPSSMMSAVEQMLASLKFPMTNLHQESFFF